MSGHLRIRSEAANLRTVVQGWQARHGASSAVSAGPPGVLLIAGDARVGAVEELVRALDPSEVEMVWRA